MNSASEVSGLVSAWIAGGMAKPEIVTKAAEACMDWPYVWGAVGAECTPSKREYYMGRSSIGEKDRENIKKRCPVLDGKQSACNGCKWFPNGQRVLINDCQGFVKNILSRVGVSLKGGGCTSMWNDNSNWTEKGKIADIPNKVCLVFINEGEKMSHVGIYIGNGQVIHCSTYVRQGSCPDKSWGWSHYAIPAGLYGDAPIQMPTLRKGSSGEYVTLLQTKLIQRGYSLDPYGADGKYGNTTMNAVKQFQTDNGLAADGITGKNTWAALENGSTPIQYYSVIVSHLTESQAKSLAGMYDHTEIEKEVG